jgi:hypothetical protein
MLSETQRILRLMEYDSAYTEYMHRKKIIILEHKLVAHGLVHIQVMNTVLIVHFHEYLLQKCHLFCQKRTQLFIAWKRLFEIFCVAKHIHPVNYM